ncbi:site-specific integrase [Draconibacterium orientale]|uniref:site-specific integrase n=1 Tax=Draconibacterium orientale TaxID=1168034 RepID=UPI0029C00007|nr:site-specific integrase [Draconibacterium orientale]
MENFNTYNLAFVLRNSRKNNEGKSPVYMRITVNGQRAEVAIKRHIHKDNWENKACKAKGYKSEVKQLNQYLETLKALMNDYHTEMVKMGEEISAQSLKNKFLGISEDRRMLIEVFEYHNHQLKELEGTTYASATIKRYTTTLDHIKAFLVFKYQLNDIPLNRLKYSFITDLEHYFKVTRKCNHNTTIKYIKNFRKVINLAIKNEWLSKDPFAKFQAKIVEVKREYLLKDELQNIEDLNLTFPRLDIVRDIFVFSCYSGLAYVDVANLTKNNIRLGIDGDLWIITERTKTKSQSNIPLLPKAHELIKKYSRYPNKKTEDHIFPIFTNQRMNAYLKEIADLASVDKNLTFHIARHTFATTVTLANGVPIESISSMLGHKSIRTTQIYSKVINAKVSEDMDKLKRKLS